MASLCLLFGMSLHLVRSVVIDYSFCVVVIKSLVLCNFNMITEKMAKELVEMFKREVMLKVYSLPNTPSYMFRL